MLGESNCWLVKMYHRRTATPSLLLPVIIGVMFALIFFYLSNRPAAEDSLAPTLAATTESQQAIFASVASPEPTVSSIPNTRLVLPNAGVYAPIIDVFIRDGVWDVASLGGSVGHLQGTAPLDVVGNHALAGHSELRDGSRGIFAWIQELNYGDPIHVEMGSSTYEYRVTGLRRVEPTDLSVLRSTETDRLTLITCDDYDFLRDLYTTRVVVIADRVS